jgi:hypothetical protein
VIILVCPAAGLIKKIEIRNMVISFTIRVCLDPQKIGYYPLFSRFSGRISGAGVQVYSDQEDGRESEKTLGDAADLRSTSQSGRAVKELS